MSKRFKLGQQTWEPQGWVKTYKVEEGKTRAAVIFDEEPHDIGFPDTFNAIAIRGGRHGANLGGMGVDYTGLRKSGISLWGQANSSSNEREIGCGAFTTNGGGRSGDESAAGARKYRQTGRGEGQEVEGMAVMRWLASAGIRDDSAQHQKYPFSRPSPTAVAREFVLPSYIGQYPGYFNENGVAAAIPATFATTAHHWPSYIGPEYPVDVAEFLAEDLSSAVLPFSPAMFKTECIFEAGGGEVGTGDAASPQGGGIDADLSNMSADEGANRRGGICVVVPPMPASPPSGLASGIPAGNRMRREQVPMEMEPAKEAPLHQTTQVKHSTVRYMHPSIL